MGNGASLWTRIKGKIMRPVADAAGDREAEAKAEHEAQTGREPDRQTLHVVKEHIRERHHDTQPAHPTDTTNSAEAPATIDTRNVRP